MSGIFVAYHNTREIFGFQFIPREEMDQRLYGNSLTGDVAFNLLMQIYNKILEKIVPLYKAEATIRLTFSLTDRNGSCLSIFSEDISSNQKNFNPPNISTLKSAASYDPSKPGTDQRHFVLSLDSFLDSKLTEHVILTSPNENWSVNFKLIPKLRVGKEEYAMVRQKIINLGRSSTGTPANISGAKYGQSTHNYGRWPKS